MDKQAEEDRKLKLQDVLGHASPALKSAVQAALHKGASSWVTCQPMLMIQYFIKTIL